jgi:hypothetical protein
LLDHLGETANLADMAHLAAVLAVYNDSALDWALGAAASFVFIGLIAVPAAVMNSRERKRRTQGVSPEQPATH